MERKTIEHFITERLSMPVVKAALISGDIEDLESHFKIALMDIVQWRINSVWHDVSEKPNGMFVIIIDFGNEISPEEFGLGMTSDDLNGAKRWAYISDLLPKRKKKTNGGR